MLKVTHQQQRLWMPAPLSVNELFRDAGLGADTKRSGRIKTREYEAWRQLARQEIMLQKPMRHEGRVTLAFFFAERSPLADCTNYIKAPEDLLVDMEIIEGDHRKCVQGLDKVAWVPNYTGMVVHITPYVESEPLWLGFDAGVMGQVQGSTPAALKMHPRAMGRMKKMKLTGEPKKVT